MYKVAHYNKVNREQIISFMKEIPLAMLCGITDEYPVATQIPVEVTEDGDKLILGGHMMKNTDHHRAFLKNDHVLALFTSPHAYINANWYSDPAGGSTVNYITVHAKGRITFLDDAGTYEAVKKITEKYIGHNTPASFENISDEYKASHIKAISGFTIEIEHLDAVWKLSQNKPEHDRLHIMEQLEKRNQNGDRFIAAKMKEVSSHES